MNLQEFATPIASKNRFIKASFGGFAGSGKSRTSAEFVIGVYKQLKLEKPILIIDNEKGSRFLIPQFEAAGITAYLKETTDLEDVLKAMDLLDKGEIDFLFIDSLSKVWYKSVNDYKARNGRNGKPKPFMQLDDWGKVIPWWQETFANRLVECEGNIVFTGRGGYEYDMEEQENGKKQFVRSGVKMKVAGETPFEPDINIWMERVQEMSDGDRPSVYREAMVMKDRSGLIDGMVFRNPSYADFKPVVDYVCSVKIGDVAGSSGSNIAPSEEYDGKRKQREVLLDEIKSELIGIAPGLSSQEKLLKHSILESVFGTGAWKKVETIGIDGLSIGVRIIRGLRSWIESLSGEFGEDFKQDLLRKTEEIRSVESFNPNEEDLPI